MPTYDYECKSCGYTFEYFQSMSDAPLDTCPKCGKEVRRLIGGGLGIIFKGSGFYVTDNKGASSSVAPGASSCEGCKSESHAAGHDTPCKEEKKETSSKKETPSKPAKEAVAV